MKKLTEYCNQNSINEYLSTNVKIRKFPDKPKTQDFINYFKENDFYELKYDGLNNYSSIHDDFMQCIDKCYMIGKEGGWIRFKNYGTITKENPLFFVFVNNDGKEEKHHGNNHYVVGFINTDADKINFYTYSEFLEYVNKIFN